jgi:hypothetical protein
MQKGDKNFSFLADRTIYFHFLNVFRIQESEVVADLKVAL